MHAVLPGNHNFAYVGFYDGKAYYARLNIEVSRVVGDKFPSVVMRTRLKNGAFLPLHFTRNGTAVAKGRAFNL